MQNDVSVDWIWSCSLEGNLSFLCSDYKNLAVQFFTQVSTTISVEWYSPGASITCPIHIMWRMLITKTLFLALTFIFSRFQGKGAYIKYVGGGGGGGFCKFFKKFLVAQETIDLNTSWPSNFFRKYFMTPPINFSFLFKAYLQQYFRVVLSNIQISNHQRSWHSQ